MKVVFLGPSLARDAALDILPGAIIAPPVAQGDIASICRMATPPEAIGIVDGLFRKSLSVWHKEILFALSRGVRVLGASSMGALRAVECEPWGAEPVGEIAAWVKAGLASDADVALAHAGAEHGWRALSVPMVNVLATLAACAELPAFRYHSILKAAARLFYADRTWPGIFEAGQCTPAEREVIAANPRDQKATDARAMLGEMSRPAKGRHVRVAVNIFENYGAVLHGNDVRIPTATGARKAWEVAKQNAWALRAGNERVLAVEMAQILGMDKDLPEIPYDAEEARKLDLLPHEYLRFRREEMMLARAAVWVSATDNGHGDAPRILSHLRSAGIYDEMKKAKLCP